MTHFPNSSKPRAGLILGLFVALTALAAGVSDGSNDSSDHSVVVGGKKLVLNGQATRSVWGFSVYHVGLFLEKGEKNGDFIMSGDMGAKRVRMQMLRTVVREDFISAVNESIDRNLTTNEKLEFASELASYSRCLEEAGNISEGSIVTIDYVPGQGMVLSLDSKTLGKVAGYDFYHVMLRLWIGQPLQPSIKTGLLAGG